MIVNSKTSRHSIIKSSSSTSILWAAMTNSSCKIIINWLPSSHHKFTEWEQKTNTNTQNIKWWNQKGLKDKSFSKLVIQKEFIHHESYSFISPSKGIPIFQNTPIIKNCFKLHLKNLANLCSLIMWKLSILLATWK